MPKTVDIVLTGRVLAGFSHRQVAMTLAKMLDISEAKAVERIAGRESVLSKGVLAHLASRHIRILNEAGLEARIVESGLAESTDPAMAHDAPRAASVPSGLELELVPLDEPKADTQAYQSPVMAGPTAGDGIPAARDERLPLGVQVVEHETPPLIGLSLTGRIGRLRYIAWGVLGNLLIVLLAALYLLLSGALTQGTAIAGSSVSLLVTAVFGLLPLLWILRITVLRLHDLELSGYWLLAMLVPGGIASILTSMTLAAIFMIAAAIGVIALAVLPGYADTNDYGHPPGENSIWVILGAGFSILVYIFGSLGYDGVSRVQRADTRAQALDKAGSADRTQAPEAMSGPVYADVRIKAEMPAGAFEFVMFAHAADQADCQVGIAILRDSLTPEIMKKCPKCAIVKSECTPHLVPRYAKLFDNEPGSVSYISVGRGIEAERELRIIFWGLTAEQSDKFCTDLVPQLQMSNRGHVRCIHHI